jgi:hypothetical protein
MWRSDMHPWNFRRRSHGTVSGGRASGEGIDFVLHDLSVVRYSAVPTSIVAVTVCQ